MSQRASKLIRCWSVAVDGKPKATFDRMDVALAYLRADIATNGSQRATLESSHMTKAAYRRLVDREEAGLAHV